MYNLFMSVIMAFTLNTDSWKTTLPIMLYGMLGIFIVIGVIVLVTYLLNKATSAAKNRKNKKDE